MRQQIPAAAYRNYRIALPAATHYRPASCEEVGCEQFLKGWITRVPSGSQHEHLITTGGTGRKYVETTDLPAQAASVREFLFEPGQPCFKASTHQVRLDKPANFLVHQAGHRLLLPNGVAWRDDMGEHLDKVRENRERG